MGHPKAGDTCSRSPTCTVHTVPAIKTPRSSKFSLFVSESCLEQTMLSKEKLVHILEAANELPNIDPSSVPSVFIWIFFRTYIPRCWNTVDTFNKFVCIKHSLTLKYTRPLDTTVQTWLESGPSGRHTH